MVQDNHPNRRDMLRLALASAISGQNALAALAKADAGENPYPWINDTHVHKALLELDRITAQLPLSGEASHIMRAIYAVNTPEETPIGETGEKRLFSDPFWKALNGERNQSSIEHANRRLQEIYRNAEALEPRRRKLARFIEERTGQRPFMLRMEPKWQTLFKEIGKEGWRFIAPEDECPILKKAADTMRGYFEAYVKGELREFITREYVDNWQDQRLDSSSVLEKGMKGADYHSGKKELENCEKVLEHFLNVPSTTIDSTIGKGPMSYSATIYTSHDIRHHIKDMLRHRFPKHAPGCHLMQVQEHHPSPAVAMAYGKHAKGGFLTISDPPAALMDMIEAAKAKKSQGLSR